jgi:hypothetical protein
MPQSIGYDLKGSAEHTAFILRIDMTRMNDGLYYIRNNKQRLDYMTNWNGLYRSWTGTEGRHQSHKKLSPTPSSERLVIILIIKASEMHYFSSLF